MDISTSGWTIAQWIELQESKEPKAVIDNLVNLVQGLNKNDPAWIEIANENQIAVQWSDFMENFDKKNDYPLFGVPFAVKDNIDVKGFRTTAACPSFAYTPAEDATVISLLKKAGAIVIGKTNLDQFATGLVGTRSPYGKPCSAFSRSHISGGSSSGSASVVARGIVPFSLGTDTAGSGRVPAHLNNLIGTKPTRGLVSTKGVVPACKSLDCVSIFTLILRDSEIVLKVIASYDANDPYSRKVPEIIRSINTVQPRLAVPDYPEWYGDKLNPEVWYQGLEDMKRLGFKIVLKNFSLFYRLAACLYEGPWVAERLTVVKNFIKTEPNIDPVVSRVIRTGEKYSAVHCFEFEYLRNDLLRKIEEEFGDFDGFIVPTAPLNPTFKQIESDPIVINSQLGTYTNFVNLADFCALAVPCGFRKDSLPFGITLLSWRFQDYALLEIGMRFLTSSEHLGRQIGATNYFTNDISDRIRGSLREWINFPIVVVGAHLRGMSLNYQLTELGGKFVRETRTSSNYRLYALETDGHQVEKPGLQRVGKSGSCIQVEVWNLPVHQVGRFLAQVPSPLGIGSIELEDRTWLKGFICEDFAFSTAVDITEFGGWTSYLTKRECI